MLILVKFSEGFGFSAEACTPKYQAFLRGGGSGGGWEGEEHLFSLSSLPTSPPPPPLPHIEKPDTQARKYAT